MGNFLLSIASPELLSWAGFVVLAIALLGEAAICVIPKKWDTLHREAAFAFAVLAAGGYAVERVGDDAIIDALKKSEATAESALNTIKNPRIITDSQYAAFVECLKPGPKGPVYVRPGMLDTDGPPLAKRIEDALKEAGFIPPSAAFPGGDALSWSKAGIFLIVKELTNNPVGAQIQRCFKSAIGWSVLGDADPKHPEGAVSIGIGPRL